MKSRKPKPSIGWREWVALPDLGVNKIKVKVDTGARTSALHAHRIEPEEREDGLWVTFYVHPMQRTRSTGILCQAKVLERRTVRDSGGHEEERYLVKSTVQLGDKTWPIEITLTSRDTMGFRMLLGRTAVRRRYLVDSGRSFLIGNNHG